MSDNATLRESTAEEIRVLLARRKISGSELARKIGVTQPYISRRLNGEVAFDLDDLERIAEFLEVEVTELLPAREGRVVGTSPASRNVRFSRGGQTAPAKTANPTSPNGPARRDEGPSVPASSRRPGRVRSAVRSAAA